MKGFLKHLLKELNRSKGYFFYPFIIVLSFLVVVILFGELLNPGTLIYTF